MNCAWQELLNVLPIWMRQQVNEKGRSSLQEIRMRINQKPQLIFSSGTYAFGKEISADDLKFVINVASKYSPWSSETITRGYISAPGGHRIGIAGDYVMNRGVTCSVRFATSLCIRVARDIPGFAGGIRDLNRSILIIGKPGSGKTTLLRDLIRRRSNIGKGSVCVVDERCELFPVPQGISSFAAGLHTDILSGCCKKQGLDIALRTMGPSCIAVDEISAKEDCDSLLQAGWCGVQLYATAHAASKEELFTRPVYTPILSMQLFQNLITLNEQKEWKEETLLC